MSTHQALARRWRPQSFDHFVGQPHAVKALQQSLERNRIHHAHLFTGTRGVGKTTLARVFAKGLSCIQGITAEPCGVCAHCTAITQGNFIDLIEIDAASRTKVEDTKELLSQVNYPPVQGRFKIYLIDEVHSLSANSFNALLKTLEEPPEHVKFILATTDPQKLPITILSRCLQLHLQHHKLDDIAGHLRHVAENIGKQFEDEAIAQIAEAASGSLRDALSLFEQAVAAAEETISNKIVSAMFGRAEETDVIQLLCAISQRDYSIITPILDKLGHSATSYASILDQCLRALYRMIQIQLIPHNQEANAAKCDKAYEHAAKIISSEQLQLYVDMIVRTKNDLDLYPSQEMGFNILVMRMSAFKLEDSNLSNLIMQASSASDSVDPSAVTNHAAQAKSLAVTQAHAQDILKSKPKAAQQPKPSASLRDHQQPVAQPTSSATSPVATTNRQSECSEWEAVLSHQLCTGMMRQIFQQSQCRVDQQHPDQWEIMVDPSLGKLITPAFKDRASQLCHSVLNKTVHLNFTVSEKKTLLDATPQDKTKQPPRPQPKQTTSNSDVLKSNQQLNQFAAELDATTIDS